MKTTTTNNTGGSIATLAIFSVLIVLMVAATLQGADKVVGYDKEVTTERVTPASSNEGITMNASDFIEFSNSQIDNEFGGLANDVKASKAEQVTIYQAGDITIITF